MDGHEFYTRVDKHSDLEWLGVQEGRSLAEDEAIIRHTTTGAKYAVAVSAILEHPWAELEAVLTGKRVAKLMSHLSRIVGYFSRIANWNASKLAELHDRHNGQYSLDEQPKKKKIMIPGVIGRKSVGAEERIRTSTPEGTGV